MLTTTLLYPAHEEILWWECLHPKSSLLPGLDIEIHIGKIKEDTKSSSQVPVFPPIRKQAATSDIELGAPTAI